MITQAPLDDPENAPGGRAALARGCVCSVLANAAHRTGGVDEPPLIEPGCPVHTPDPHPTGSTDVAPTTDTGCDRRPAPPGAP